MSNVLRHNNHRLRMYHGLLKIETVLFDPDLEEKSQIDADEALS